MPIKLSISGCRRSASASAGRGSLGWLKVPGFFRAGREIGAGAVVLDEGSPIVIAHSDSEGAAPTYKHAYGFHPALVAFDNTAGPHPAPPAPAQRGSSG